jgi:hypothetical protein
LYGNKINLKQVLSCRVSADYYTQMGQAGKLSVSVSQRDFARACTLDLESVATSASEAEDLPEMPAPEFDP